MKHLPLITALILCISGMPLAAQSPRQLNYIASQLPAAEWPEQWVMADLNGDGRQDLILPQWQEETGRQLLVFLQQENSRFPVQPSRFINILPEIVAITFADLRPDPGEELILFTGNGAFSLATAIDGYSGNVRPLIDWPLAAAIPDRRRTLVLPPPQDMDGDGHVDLLLPGIDGYGWFRGGDDEQFQLARQFSTINEELDPTQLPDTAGRFSTQIQINQRDGLIVRITARPNSAFEDFVDDNSEADRSVLLDSSHWMPPAAATSLSRAGASDIAFLNIGNDIRGQINILLQQDNGGFADQPWQAAIDMEGDIQLLDINGDGLTDVMRTVNDSNDWDVYFYLNKGQPDQAGLFDFDSPDQVMRFSGYDLQLSVTDILGNGSPVLGVSYYTIPVVNAIRNTSIVRTQLLYNSQGGRVFNTRPDFRLEESFSASSVRGLSSPIYLQADLSGNGRVDALYLTADGTLAAKTIDPNLQFASEPFWQYVPDRTIIGFAVEDINADGRPDIILYHSTTTTVLVSSP